MCVGVGVPGEAGHGTTFWLCKEAGPENEAVDPCSDTLVTRSERKTHDFLTLLLAKSLLCEFSSRIIDSRRAAS